MSGDPDAAPRWSEWASCHRRATAPRNLHQMMNTHFSGLSRTAFRLGKCHDSTFSREKERKDASVAARSALVVRPSPTRTGATIIVFFFMKEFRTTSTQTPPISRMNAASATYMSYDLCVEVAMNGLPSLLSLVLPAKQSDQLLSENEGGATRGHYNKMSPALQSGISRHRHAGC